MNAQNSMKKMLTNQENARRVLTSVLLKLKRNFLLLLPILVMQLENAQDSCLKIWPTTNARLSLVPETKSLRETEHALMPVQIMISKMLTTNALFLHALRARNFHSPVFALPHAQNSTRMLTAMANVLSSPTTPVVQMLHTKKATRNA